MPNLASRSLLVLALAAAALAEPDYSQRDPGPRALAAAGRLDPAEVLDRFARSWTEGLCGEVVFMSRPGVFFTNGKYPRNHGSAWDYDCHVPLLFYGPGQVRAGRQADPHAEPLDVPATLSAAIGIEPPPASEGKAWSELLVPGRKGPKAMLLCVMDQVGYADVERFADRLPTLSRWRRLGADFSQARWRHLPTFTGVSHASIATGAPPVVHGVAQNFIPNADRTGMRVIFREESGRVDPSYLKVPTLADWMDLQLGNKPVVITQIYADYAAVALGGRGASFPGGDWDIVAWFDPASGHMTTDERYFRIPDYLARRSVRDRLATLREQRDRWRREVPGTPELPLDRGGIMAFPGYARWEADGLLLTMSKEGVGRDEVPDLVQVNLKSTDALGHALGHDHPGFLECLQEVDRFLGEAERYLDSVAGRGRWLAAVTADHGLVPDDGAPREEAALAAWLGHELDATGNRDGKSMIMAVDGYHVYLDRAEMRAEGHTLEDVKRVLLRSPDVWAAWTADEVRARLGHAPMRP